jgi:hypothetical protein
MSEINLKTQAVSLSFQMKHFEIYETIAELRGQLLKRLQNKIETIGTKESARLLKLTHGHVINITKDRKINFRVKKILELLVKLERLTGGVAQEETLPVEKVVDNIE